MAAARAIVHDVDWVATATAMWQRTPGSTPYRGPWKWEDGRSEKPSFSENVNLQWHLTYWSIGTRTAEPIRIVGLGCPQITPRYHTLFWLQLFALSYDDELENWHIKCWIFPEAASQASNPITFQLVLVSISHYVPMTYSWHSHCILIVSRRCCFLSRQKYP